VLLREMQIQNPTAVMIARSAVAQDDVVGWVGHTSFLQLPIEPATTYHHHRQHSSGGPCIPTQYHHQQQQQQLTLLPCSWCYTGTAPPPSSCS
jgi:hypothetical protein